jgi:hypothetical protein
VREFKFLPPVLPVLLLGVVMMAAFSQPAIAAGPSLRLVPLSEIDLAAWAAGSESPARIVGDRLLIPLGAGGLAIYDIADPANPVPVALLDTAALGGQAGAVAALPGDRLFVSLPVQHTIAVFDFSGALPPIKLGEFGDIPQAIELATTDTGLLAYAQSSVAYLGGIYAFDVTSQIPLAAGEFLVSLIDPGFLAIRNGIALMARTPAHGNDTPGLDIVDMADPANPRLLGSWKSPLFGNVTGIDIDGDRMFLSAYWGGLWVVDVSNYSMMKLTASFDWEEAAHYAVDLVSLPPFVLLLQGGPQPSMRRLDTLLVQENGQLRLLDDDIPLTGFPTSVIREGRLVLVEELSDTYDRKKLRLFDADVDLFNDGFESGAP